MGHFDNFATILENKLRKEILSEIQPNVHSEQAQFEDTTYLHLSWILGQTPILKSTVPQKKTPYQKAKKAPSPRPAHKLDQTQLRAFELLKKLSPNFANNFSNKELKHAYRIAVFKTHPDHGGSTNDFCLVRQAYESLAILFKF